MNRVTIDGDPAYLSSESDSHHVYSISFSERPIGATLGVLKKYIVNLVRVVSGPGEQLVDDYQDIQWPGQPALFASGGKALAALAVAPWAMQGKEPVSTFGTSR
jgi:hypothetical protein